MAKIDELITRYLALRDKKGELEKVHKERIKKMDEMLEKIEGHLLGHMRKDGVTSISVSGVGTAYQNNKVRVPVVDWDAFLAWAKRNDRLDMVERRVSTTTVREYREAENKIPPGLDWQEYVDIAVRRT